MYFVFSKKSKILQTTTSPQKGHSWSTGNRVWYPDTNSNIDFIIRKKVQRRATILVMNDYENITSVAVVVNKVQWLLLKRRREKISLPFLRAPHEVIYIDSKSQT